MANEQNTCPCCPNHCSLSKLSCEKGVNYLKTGEIPHGDDGHQHHHGRHEMPDLNTTSGLLMACGHALHHLSRDCADPFQALSQAEREELEGLLNKLLNSWERDGHGRKHH